MYFQRVYTTRRCAILRAVPPRSVHKLGCTVPRALPGVYKTGSCTVHPLWCTPPVVYPLEVEVYTTLPSVYTPWMYNSQFWSPPCDVHSQAMIKIPVPYTSQLQCTFPRCTYVLAVYTSGVQTCSPLELQLV